MSAVQLLEFRFGRNVKGVPMSADRWARFQAEARAALDGIAAGEARRSAVELTQWVELHTGVGTWVNDDGTAESEESAVATLFTTAADAHLNAGLLHDFAAEFAAEFDQDAVAVVVRGASALVDAAGRVRR